MATIRPTHSDIKAVIEYIGSELKQGYTDAQIAKNDEDYVIFFEKVMKTALLSSGRDIYLKEDNDYTYFERI